MGLKRTIDKQIYSRERLPLGQTNIAAVGATIFNDNYSSSKKYKLPVQWISKAYYFDRPTVFMLKMEEFLEFSGSISTNIMPISPEGGITSAIVSGTNIIFASHIYSQSGFSTDINFTTSHVGIITIALFYDGQWTNNISQLTQNLKTTLVIPAEKDVIIGIAFYAFAMTKYDIEAEFSQASDIVFYNTLNIETPPRPTLTLRKDTKTQNIAIDVCFIPPKNQLSWTATRIWRKQFEVESFNIYKTSDSHIMNGFYLSTANIAINYSPGKILDYSSAFYVVQKSYDLAANKITNGAFYSTAGWAFYHTSTIGIPARDQQILQTAYAVKEYPYENDKCVRFNIGNTVSTVKTSYMEPKNWIPITVDSAFSFICNLRSATDTSFSPYIKFMFAKNSGGTLCSTASALSICRGLSSVWQPHQTQLKYWNPQTSYNSGIIIPRSCTYIKPKIYISYGLKMAHKVYIDCVGLYATSYIGVYNASTKPLSFININETITEPITNSTYDIFLGQNNTLVGQKGKTLSQTGSINYRGPIFTSRFNGGFETIYPTTNYIKGGDFQDSTKFIKTYPVQFLSTSDTMYSNRIVYFPYSASVLSISTARVLAQNIDGNTAWSMSIWAKAGAQAIRPHLAMQFGNTTKIISHTFPLSTEWDRYYFTGRIGVISTDKTLKVKITTSTAYNGDIILSGWQIEPYKFITGFGITNTAAGAINGANLNLIAAETQKIVTASCANISFCATLENTFVSSAYPIHFISIDDGVRYINWYYSYVGKKLILDVNGTFLYHTCTFGARETLFFNLGWNQNRIYAYYNGITKYITKPAPASMPQSPAVMAFGANPNSYWGNAIFSNIKIDTASFTPQRIKAQERAYKYEPLTYGAAQLKKTDYISVDVPKGQSGNTIVYADQRDILSNKTYSYKIQYLDGDLAGPYSDSTSISTRTVNYPPPITNGFSIAGANWIDFKWLSGSTSLTHHYLVYMSNDKNYTAPYVQRGPIYVPANPAVASATFTLWDIYDPQQRSIWVLGVDVWDNANTANAVKIVGYASETIWARNIVGNSSFEYLNPKDKSKVVFWSTVDAGYISGGPPFPGHEGQITDQYFYTGGQGSVGMITNAGYSVRAGEVDIVTYCWPAQTVQLVNFNSASPYQIRYSHWFHTVASASGGGYLATIDGVSIRMCDAYGKTMASRVLNLRKIAVETGWDGKTWTRYATVFSHSMGFVAGIGRYPTSIKFAPFHSVYGGAIAGVKNCGGYVDAIQMEIATAGQVAYTAYVPSRYSIQAAVSQGGNPYEIPNGTLNITKFVGNSIVLAGSTGDSGRIIIGQEKTSNTFQEFTPTRARFHPAGTDTGYGFNFAKHIESGVGIYGKIYTFNNRYKNWSGNPISPFLIVAPKDLMSFCTAAGIANKTQRISFTQDATAGGFTAGAYLYANTGKYFDNSVIQFCTGTGSSGTTRTRTNIITQYKTGGPSYDQWGATVFPKKSKTNIGVVRYNVSGINLGAGKVYDRLSEVSAVVTFYCSACTAGAIAPFVVANNWRLLGQQIVGLSYTSNQYTFNINNSYFSRASALCISVQKPDTIDIRATIDPVNINLSTSISSVYVYDSAMGTFYWMATDGGQV